MSPPDPIGAINFRRKNGGRNSLLSAPSTKDDRTLDYFESVDRLGPNPERDEVERVFVSLPFFWEGNFFRGVLARSWSSFSDIDSDICLEAPFSLDFELSPRFAESAAPAAICCFLERAGIDCLLGSHSAATAIFNLSSSPSRVALVMQGVVVYLVRVAVLTDFSYV